MNFHNVLSFYNLPLCTANFQCTLGDIPSNTYRAGFLLTQC